MAQVSHVTTKFAFAFYLKIHTLTHTQKQHSQGQIIWFFLNSTIFCFNLFFLQKKQKERKQKHFFPFKYAALTINLNFEFRFEKKIPKIKNILIILFSNLHFFYYFQKKTSSFSNNYQCDNFFSLFEQKLKAEAILFTCRTPAQKVYIICTHEKIYIYVKNLCKLKGRQYLCIFVFAA